MQRSSHGRKPKFASGDVLWDACCEYFEWVEANPLYEDGLVTFQGQATHEPVAKMRAMTISGLCIFLDISRQAWDEYRTREGYGDIASRVDEVIRTQKFEGASAGLLNPNIIARDLGLADKQDTSMNLKADDTIAGLLSRIAVAGARLVPEPQENEDAE